MKSFGIPWANCVSFSCDNASVMTGVHKGVAAFLKSYNPELLLIGCSCHLLHLAAEKAAATLPVSVDELLVDVFYYFDKSAKRKDELKQFQELCSQPYRKILKHICTRWLSVGKCLDRLILLWRPLRKYFQKLMTEREKKKNHAAKKQEKTTGVKEKQKN